MGRGNNYKKLIMQWIDEIPDSKLEGGIAEHTLWKDKYMRLDNQRTVNKDGIEHFNLQVQVNYNCPHSTLVKLAPDTVAFCLAPVDVPWTAQEIRTALRESVTFGRLGRPGM